MVNVLMNIINTKEAYPEVVENKDKEKVDKIYIEGDAVCFKKQNGEIQFIHVFILHDGVETVSNNRKQSKNMLYFVDIRRKKARDRLKSYLQTHYDMRNIMVIANSDGGSGYEEAVFRDIAGVCNSFEYFIDRYIEVIPNQTNIKVNPHLSFDQFKQTKDSNIYKVNIIRPIDPTVGNPKDKNDRGKQVSIDGGKTWSDFKDLAKHDSLYDWKSTFNPSKYLNFDGHGSLTLTGTFEHLQTIGELKVATITNEQLNDLVDEDLVEIQERAGNRISDKFTFTVEPFNKLAVTIKAGVKAEFADEFDDLGGVNQGDLQTLVLYIRQVTVRGATGHEEIHYLDADNRVYIPNIAGIKEDSGIKHFTGKEKTNVAKVRLPMVEPAIEKYVEADGDDSGQNHAIDQNAEQNMIMDKALERAQRVLEEVQKLSNIPEDVQKAMDKLVETVAEVSSTAEDINKATEKLEERVNKALEKKNDKSEPVTLTEAQEFAQDVLKKWKVYQFLILQMLKKRKKL